MHNRLLLCLFAIALACVAPARPSTAQASEAPVGESSSAGGPQRVICMAPSITEVVFALGQGERVVGVSDFSTFPEEAQSKPRCGGWMNPNLEVITALEPDAVLVQGKHQKLRDYCNLREIPLVEVEMNDLPAILEGIWVIGSALSVRERAEDLCRQMAASLDSVRARVAGLTKPKVFLLLGRTPGTLSGLYTTGPGTFLTDILEYAGGTNIFGDLALEYPHVSKEAVVARQPDVILEMHPGKHYDAQTLSRLQEDWKPLWGIPAIGAGRIYIMTANYAMIPGPRLVQLARDMGAIFHPDLADE